MRSRMNLVVQDLATGTITTLTPHCRLGAADDMVRVRRQLEIIYPPEFGYTLLSPLEPLPRGTLAVDTKPLGVAVHHEDGGRLGSWQQWMVLRPGIGERGE